MRNKSLVVLLLLFELLALTRAASRAPASSRPIHGAVRTAVARVPFEANGNAMLLQLRVNDRGPFSFVLDTGAQASLLDTSTAESLGLGGERQGDVKGAGGQVPGITLRDLAFDVGGARVDGRQLAAVPLTAIASSMGRRVDGVLGSELFRRFVVEIDYEKKEIGLYEPSGFVYEGGGDVLPLEFHLNLPYVRAKVTLPGQRGIDGQFVVDSGSNFPLILLPSFIEKRQLRASLPPTLEAFGRGVGGEIAMPVGRSDVLELGRFTIERPVTAFPEEGHFGREGKAGNIGGAILRRFKVTFDYSRERMMLEPNGRFAEPYEHDMSGLSLLAEAPDFRTVRVHRVLSSSPAEEGGIRAGDEIVSVGGRPVMEAGLLALREMLRKPGNRLVLEVRREGALLALELTTRRLI